MLGVQIHLAKEAIAGRTRRSELYVAADGEGNLLGYILLGIAADYYTGESRAYVYTLVRMGSRWYSSNNIINLIYFILYQENEFTE